MTSSAQRLQEIEERIAVDPAAVEPRFERAALLAEMDRLEEAKQGYLEILATVPTHRGTLNKLGDLLYATGYRSAAHTAYSEAVKFHPDDPTAHANLADILRDRGEDEAARHHYETALCLNPDHRGAHEAMVYLLIDQGEWEAAQVHRRAAFAKNPVSPFGFRGKGTPIPVVVLVAGDGGDMPFHRLIDFRIFQVTTVTIEFFDPTEPLPPHEMIFNAIGDADLSRASLEAAQRVLATVTSPVINRPENVLVTGRAGNAERLGRLPGVTAARISNFSREDLSGADAGAFLSRHGFEFPLLLRSPGFHTGRHFVRVENREEVAAALPGLPGETLIALQYLDARRPDGKVCKYRVMMIGGKLYPLHMAVSSDWKVHYFTAEMADSAAHRAEDRAFLENMPQALGTRAMEALAAIQKELGLDYAGIDFSLGKDGEVLIFEANATMTVTRPPAGDIWDYRRQPVQRILDAIREMLFAKARRPATPPASPSARPAEAGSRDLPSTSELLTTGGDLRIACLPGQGANRYGCAPVPEPEVLPYGSSTASTISGEGFAAAERLRDRLLQIRSQSREEPAAIYARELERVRRELTELCGLDSLPGVEIVFAASGTDLHLFAAQLAAAGPEAASAIPLIVMAEAGETGSGVPQALGGRHFSNRAALGNAVAASTPLEGGRPIETVILRLRTDDGLPRPAAEIDAEVAQRVAEAVAVGRSVLLSLVDGSKSAMIAPSPSEAFLIAGRFPKEVLVLVDACQFRIAPATLRAYLEAGFLVALTGSKFVSGPAFCGALLVPERAARRLRTRPLPYALKSYSPRADWPIGWTAGAGLFDLSNEGLLLRWEAALAELRAFRALDEAAVLGFAEHFARAVAARLAEDEVFAALPVPKLDRGPFGNRTGWDRVQTVFPFLLRQPGPDGPVWLNREATVRVYQLLGRDLGAHAGLPESAREPAALRCQVGQPIGCGQRGGVAVSALRLCLSSRLIVEALGPEGRGPEEVIARGLAVLDKAALLVRLGFGDAPV